MHSAERMASLRLVRPDERFMMEPPPTARAFPRWLWGVTFVCALAATVALVWWSGTADTRALRALPQEQRRAIYTRTIEILRGTCDPAAPRSLRDFCRDQAQLAARLPECEADPGCQQLVRRHAFQPRR